MFEQRDFPEVNLRIGIFPNRHGSPNPRACTKPVWISFTTLWP